MATLTPAPLHVTHSTYRPPHPFLVLTAPYPPCSSAVTKRLQPTKCRWSILPTGTHGGCSDCRCAPNAARAAPARSGPVTGLPPSPTYIEAIPRAAEATIGRMFRIGAVSGRPRAQRPFALWPCAFGLTAFGLAARDFDAAALALAGLGDAQGQDPLIH
jgi:hypothetical protein